MTHMLVVYANGTIIAYEKSGNPVPQGDQSVAEYLGRALLRTDNATRYLAAVDESHNVSVQCDIAAFLKFSVILDVRGVGS
jgi:hypothetical protein